MAASKVVHKLSEIEAAEKWLNSLNYWLVELTDAAAPELSLELFILNMSFQPQFKTHHMQLGYPS